MKRIILITSAVCLAHSIARMRATMRWKNSLILLIVMAEWATCGMSYADSIIGSPGAGFQSWTVSFQNLNTSGAPYWDYPTTYPTSNVLGFPPFTTAPPGDFANVGFCLTGTINCPERFLNPGPPPGAIPFWGMPYDSATDTGGARDPNFFFVQDTPNELRATLELQLSTLTTEINEFGWFETNKDGSIIGPLHPLFCGSTLGGGPPCNTATPTPIGTTVTFIPTQFYGYYYRDVSDPPPTGCLAFTLTRFNTGACLTVFEAPHPLAAFTTDPGSPLATFWIAGLNAAQECQGPDCNLTLVKVEPVLPTPGPASIRVHVGYLNTRGGQPDPAVIPAPFNPDATTTLISSGDVTSPHDTGVIRFENVSKAPVTIDRVIVITDRECPSKGFFAIWDKALPQTLAVGQNLVLAETTNFNFDSSDCGLELDPVVIFKIKDGPQSTCVDTGRTLLGREDAINTRETTPYQLIPCVQTTGGPP